MNIFFTKVGGDAFLKHLQSLNQILKMKAFLFFLLVLFASLR